MKQRIRAGEAVLVTHGMEYAVPSFRRTAWALAIVSYGRALVVAALLLMTLID